MTVTVIEPTRDELLNRRNALLTKVNCLEDELRQRVLAETATAEERSILNTLDEITFLLNDR